MMSSSGAWAVLCQDMTFMKVRKMLRSSKGNNNSKLSVRSLLLCWPSVSMTLTPCGSKPMMSQQLVRFKRGLMCKKKNAVIQSARSQAMSRKRGLLISPLLLKM